MILTMDNSPVDTFRKLLRTAITSPPILPARRVVSCEKFRLSKTSLIRESTDALIKARKCLEELILCPEITEIGFLQLDHELPHEATTSLFFPSI
jgi:hypothetical protein